MNNAAKFALVVACIGGYAAPALALNPQPLPPFAIDLHSKAPDVKLDCSDVKLFAGGEAVDASDFTATEDGNGGCDVSAKVDPNVKYFRAVIKGENAKAYVFETHALAVAGKTEFFLSR